jgi:CTP:molybdopterin cytidylyltransferase MocA
MCRASPAARDLWRRPFCRAQGPVGDRGAGALLRGAPALALDPAHALDIDRPEDLARAQALLDARA